MARKAAAETATPSVEVTEVESTTSKVKTPKKRVVRKKLDPNMSVEVTNGFHGVLVYIDKKTGEPYNWSEFGDTITMNLDVVQRAKGAQKKFFTENWWMFNDPEVIEYLGVEQYYKNALTVDGFDDIFKAEVSEVDSIIGKLSKNQKQGVKFRAKQLIESEDLTDLRMIRALEKALDAELIDTE